MFTLGKSKRYHIAYTHLKNSGFFYSDFNCFHIKEIVNSIIADPSLLVPLIEVIKEVKLKPLQVLKIQLLVHHLLQVDSKMQENELLLQLLQIIGTKVKKILNPMTSSNTQLPGNPEQKMFQSAESRNLNEPICQNQTTLLLRKIIQPMLQLQKRLIFSYDLVYPPPHAQELEISSCWAVINLLKKYVQISPHIQAIGRYFSQKYATAMVYLIKILDVDIHLLYRRIKNFISRKMNSYYSLLKVGLLQSLQQKSRLQMKEFLELIKEVEAVNEYIDRLYISKYFMSDLIGNQISMPALFTTENDLDILHQIGKNVQGKKGGSRSYSLSKKSKHSIQEIVESV